MAVRPILLAFGKSLHQVSDSVICMSGTGEEMVYTAVKKTAGILVRNFITLTSKLTDVRLDNPQQTPANVNGEAHRPDPGYGTVELAG